jgi:hypothetical protein
MSMRTGKTNTRGSVKMTGTPHKTYAKLESQGNDREVYKETKKVDGNMWLVSIEEDKSAQMLHFSAFCMGHKRTIKRDLPFDEARKVYEWGQIEETTDAKKYHWLGEQLQLVHPDADDKDKMEIWIKDYVAPKENKCKYSEQAAGVLDSFREIFKDSHHQKLADGTFSHKLGTRFEMSGEADKFAVEGGKQKDDWKDKLKPLHERLGVREVVLDTLKTKFSKLDRNGDGSVDSQEFNDLMTWLGLDKDVKKKQMLEEFDAMTKDCRVDFEEFANWLINKYPHLKNLSAREANLFVNNAVPVKSSHTGHFP